MHLKDLLTEDRVLVGVRARNKAALLAELARRAAACLSLDSNLLLAALTARERLGSTGFGRGVALPHVRVDGVSGLFGLFARLAKPVAYDAIDGVAVDLVFLLLIPPRNDTAHVAALAAVSRALRDDDVAKAIRAAGDAAGVYKMLVNEKGR